ncbi:hypothetical protein SLA2020_039400 [Shorea laevis]
MMEKMSREEKPANEDTKSQDGDLVRGSGAADGRWVEKAIGRGRCKAEKGKKYGAIGRWINRQMEKMSTEEKSANEVSKSQDWDLVRGPADGGCNREAEG